MSTFTRIYKTECLIDGKIVEYDACHTGDKNSSDKFYGDKFKYIGSSDTYFIDGRMQKSGPLTHFYVKNR